MVPLVSIIVPNYNHERFLTERLESLFAQTCQDFEIIILDDCSTDGSRQVIEQYRLYPKISQIIYNHVNSGSPFKQWKKGIELAAGAYIWIAESDDSASPHFLENLLPHLIAAKSAALAFADSVNNTKLLEEESSILKPELYPGKVFLKERMLINPSIKNASAVIFRKDFVSQNLLNECSKYTSTGDWLFWNYLLTKGDVLHLPQALNFFRQHTMNLSLNARRNGVQLLEGLSVIDFTKKNLKISIPVNTVRIWSSLIAQNFISFSFTNPHMLFTKCILMSIRNSFLSLVYLPYYLLKFKFFSSPNITR